MANADLALYDAKEAGRDRVALRRAGSLAPLWPDEVSGAGP
jgi:4'-phosphopantetheinyl transferase EntD